MSASLPLSETFLHARDGTRLFVRQARPIGVERAQVLLVHGLGEHSSRYLHVVERCVARDFSVTLFDLRGHGRSDGKRGDARNYTQLLDDMALVWAHAGRENLPRFLYGHSAGGQLALNFCLMRQPSMAGLIAASPWLDLAFAPKIWKLWLARLVIWWWPDFTQESGLGPERLSRDAEFLGSLPDLGLIHHKISARLFFEMTKGAAEARIGASQMKVPLLMLHGECDEVTSIEATRQFFLEAGSEDKKLRTYRGGLHETHNDLDRELVIREICDWIAARC